MESMCIMSWLRNKKEKEQFIVIIQIHDVNLKLLDQFEIETLDPIHFRIQFLYFEIDDSVYFNLDTAIYKYSFNTRKCEIVLFDKQLGDDSYIYKICDTKDKLIVRLWNRSIIYDIKTHSITTFINCSESPSPLVIDDQLLFYCKNDRQFRFSNGTIICLEHDFDHIWKINDLFLFSSSKQGCLLYNCETNQFRTLDIHQTPNEIIHLPFNRFMITTGQELCIYGQDSSVDFTITTGQDLCIYGQDSSVDFTFSCPDLCDMCYWKGWILTFSKVGIHFWRDPFHNEMKSGVIPIHGEFSIFSVLGFTSCYDHVILTTHHSIYVLTEGDELPFRLEKVFEYPTERQKFIAIVDVGDDKILVQTNDPQYYIFDLRQRKMSSKCVEYNTCMSVFSRTFQYRKNIMFFLRDYLIDDLCNIVTQFIC